MTSNDPVWRRACNSSNCVEVRRVGSMIEVRDSKLGEESEIIGYSLDDWSTQVIAEIRDGGWLPEASYREDDETVVLQRHINAMLQLRFTAAEWDAFVDGVISGQFDFLTTQWRSAPLTDVDPDSGTHSTPQPVSVELSADSGPVVSDDHPAEDELTALAKAAQALIVGISDRLRKPAAPGDLVDAWPLCTDYERGGVHCAQPDHGCVEEAELIPGGWYGDDLTPFTVADLRERIGEHIAEMAERAQELADEIDPPVLSAPADTNQGGTHG